MFGDFYDIGEESEEEESEESEEEELATPDNRKRLFFCKVQTPTALRVPAPSSSASQEYFFCDELDYQLTEEDEACINRCSNIQPMEGDEDESWRWPVSRRLWFDSSDTPPSSSQSFCSHTFSYDEHPLTPVQTPHVVKFKSGLCPKASVKIVPMSSVMKKRKRASGEKEGLSDLFDLFDVQTQPKRRKTESRFYCAV